MKTSMQLLVDILRYYYEAFWLCLIGPRSVVSSFTGNDVVLKMDPGINDTDVLMLCRQVRYDYRYLRWRHKRTHYLYCVDMLHLEDGKINHATTGYYPEFVRTWFGKTQRSHHYAIQAHLDMLKLNGD